MAKLEDVQPAHCYARASRLLAEIQLIRTEMGRSGDTRPLPEASNGQPRDCYFEGLATWHKADRLARELGVASSRPAPAMPVLRDLRPGHVYQLLESVLAQLDQVKHGLRISETVDEAAAGDAKQPDDVLLLIIRANRELSRLLETPFTPSDVYRTVALASAYATRAGGHATNAGFVRGKQPADCYARLESCLAKASELIGKRGHTALQSRGAPNDVLPTDVYDLANLVLGEVAFLHSLSPDAAPVHAFEPGAGAHRLPSHVDQLARTLEAQLASLAR